VVFHSEFGEHGRPASNSSSTALEASSLIIEELAIALVEHLCRSPRNLFIKGTTTNPLFFRTFAMKEKCDSAELAPIEDHLRKWNLTNWGFVIYRCTYSNDRDWKRFMDIFKRRSESVIVNSLGAPALHERLSWTVVEDASLEGATTAQVREAFEKWIFSPQAGSEISANLRQLRRIYPPSHDQEDVKVTSRVLIAPRYHYCIQVDDIALNSMLKHGMDDESSDYRGHVNLINVYWSISDPNDPEHKDAEELEYNLIDQGQPPIEGCRMHDVGWMRCDVGGMLSTLYSYLVQDGNWIDWYYRRPPLIWQEGTDYVDAPKDIPLLKE
jgi:hypothetical protein